eukprot:11195575-Lingulodinium_polyedra.AAC.1
MGGITGPGLLEAFAKPGWAYAWDDPPERKWGGGGLARQPKTRDHAAFASKNLWRRPGSRSPRGSATMPRWPPTPR